MWLTDLIVYDVNVLSVLILISVFLLVYLCIRKPPGIPPGPAYTLPVVGDIPLLIGGDVLKIFQNLRKTHGDIFSFYFGKDLTIVLNGYDCIQKAAVKKGGRFSGRPIMAINEILRTKLGIVWSKGEHWRRQRKHSHAWLQEFGFGKSAFEEKIMEEVRCFVDVVKAQKNTAFDIRHSIHASVANIIFAVISGKRHEYDDGFYQSLLDDTDFAAKKVLQISILLNCMPIIQHFPGDLLQFNLLKKSTKQFRTYLKEIYEEHIETFDENNPRDIMDMSIIERKKHTEGAYSSDFSADQIIANVVDLFGAGAETTATTIRWAVLYLMKMPDIKHRLQFDIDSVIADAELPRLDDMAKLPYIEAFIMELLRCVNVAPLAVPHALATESDILFEGYTIPNKASIIFNLDSVLKDPDVFVNPEQFNPDRFLDAAGNIVKPKEFIAFGIGRRVCLGEAVAKMELFLFLTSIIKQFDFVLPIDEPEPSLEGILGITYSPQPYKVRMVERIS